MGVDDELDLGPTRGELRMAKRAIVEGRVALALRLATLPEEALTAFDFVPDLVHALDVARRLKASGAKQRQIRYVAKMLIEGEAEIMAVLAGIDDGSIIPQTAGRLLAVRMFADPAGEIGALTDECPAADRGRLWQLIRQANEARLAAYLDTLKLP
ncbi:MAG: ribosomal 50S subunit-associated protein YjgA (DUF615 family) [Bradymonadia bacterium]|jgi:ribosomal 50S subunit-associated protein YjgA (DUF615 family)